MGVETLYPDENEGEAAIPKTSPAIAFLNILLTFIWWAGWAFLVLFILAFLYTGLSFLGIQSLQSSFEVTTPSMALLSSALAIVVVLVFLITVRQLRKICQTLVTGDPFVPENAKRLRTICIAVASGEIIRLVSSFVIPWLSKNNDTTDVQAADLRLYVWFMVLAVIILAEVFREGARMRQDAKLTV